jgi:hypothetical protein
MKKQNHSGAKQRNTEKLIESSKKGAIQDLIDKKSRKTAVTEQYFPSGNIRRRTF